MRPVIFRLLQIIRNKGSWPWGAHLRATPSETSRLRAPDGGYPPRGDYRGVRDGCVRRGSRLGNQSAGRPRLRLERRLFRRPCRLWDRQIRCRAAGAGGCSPNPKRDTLGSLYAGAHIGYNFLLTSQILLGAEADVSFPNYLGTDDIVSFAVAPTGTSRRKWLPRQRARPSRLRLRPLALVRNRRARVYQSRFLHFPPRSTDLGDAEKVLRFQDGWTAGAGVEKVSKATGASGSNIYSPFRHHQRAVPVRRRLRVRLDLHTVRIGSSQARLAGSTTASAGPKGHRPSRTPANGNCTPRPPYIHQGYPAFHALYTGRTAHAGAQAKETWSNSAFVGIRLWQGGELYYNPSLSRVSA